MSVKDAHTQTFFSVKELQNPASPHPGRRTIGNTTQGLVAQDGTGKNSGRKYFSFSPFSGL